MNLCIYFLHYLKHSETKGRGEVCGRSRGSDTSRLTLELTSETSTLRLVLSIFLAGPTHAHHHILTSKLPVCAVKPSQGETHSHSVRLIQNLETQHTSAGASHFSDLLLSPQTQPKVIFFGITCRKISSNSLCGIA